MAAGVVEVASIEEYKKIHSNAGSNLVVVHFAAPWAPQCQQMTDVMTELSKDNQLSHVKFIQIEAEKLAEISEENNIVAVPTFVFFKGGKSLDRLDGVNASDLTKKVQNLAVANVVASPPPQAQKQDLNSRLKQLIKSAPVMLFMKGNPQEPRCGFSRQIIQILNEKNVSYSTFDILSDEEVRQGLKTFSNWPTYPQLYANGELLGGLDIVKELVESGELESQLPTKVKLEDRLSPNMDASPNMDDSTKLSETMTVTSSSFCCNVIESKVCTSVSQKQYDSDNLAESMDDQTLEYTEQMDGSDVCEQSMSSSEDEGEEESLPIWFGKSEASPCTRRRSRRGKRSTPEKRRVTQKMIQRERRALIKSDPELLAAQREKERLRQMTIRKRDALIMSLAVKPEMPLSEANLILMQQQRLCGVPEDEIISVHIGRENYRTIGELKNKIEAKRAVDRERTRSKRATMEENLKEDLKKSCRDRMREKRALMKQYNPSAAAAHREREKIRKRIERRKNAMLLSLPDERLDVMKDSPELNTEAQLPFPITPEFSTALKVLKDDLLRKRVEQKEKVRRKRAELRDNHPELAAVLREKERIRKKIERRRNNFLLNLSPEVLASATQPVIGAESNASFARLVGNIPQGIGASVVDSPGLSYDTKVLPETGLLSTFQATVTASSASGNRAESVEKLEPKINNKVFNPPTCNPNLDSEIVKKMKERERTDKGIVSVKREISSTSPSPSTSICFNYDEPQKLLSASSSQDASWQGASQSDFDGSPNLRKEIRIKQEPVDDFDDSFSNVSSASRDWSLSSQVSSECVAKSIADNTQSDEISCKQNFTTLRSDDSNWNEPENMQGVVKCEPSSSDYMKDSFLGDGNAGLSLSKTSQDTASSSSKLSTRTVSCNISRRKMFKPVKAEFSSIPDEDSMNDSNCSSQDMDSENAPRGLADADDSRNNFNHRKSSVTDIPEFSSVEEERNWFQTQICCLQNRVSHKESHAASPSSVDDVPTAPEKSVFVPEHVSRGQLLSPELPPLALKPQTGSGDHYSAIAELTVRSSLEQMNALAGPNLVQAKLQEMIHLAKVAREKANEQARRRREKLRNDPELRRKYEETKSRDLERKRQQRAKEAEIRTVYPDYNEERRIKDRERKQKKRACLGSGGIVSNISPDEVSSSSGTVADNFSLACPQFPPVIPPGMSAYRLPHPGINHFPRMMPDGRFSSFYSTMPMFRAMSSIPTYQNMDNSQSTDVKPGIHPNQELAS